MQAGLTKKPMTIEDIANLVVIGHQRKEALIKRKYKQRKLTSTNENVILISFIGNIT